MQCLLSTTIMWKISAHMTSTCCPALVYEGHSCDSQTGLFKGAANVCGTGNTEKGGGGFAAPFYRNTRDCNV